MIGFLKFIAVCALVIFGIVSCNESEWHQSGVREREAKAAAQWAHDSTPRVIREADGCKVYAFKTSQGGPWTYFTRCPQAYTSTQTSWEECTGSGKSRRCETKTSTVGNQ